MIMGLGTDIVEIERIAGMIERHGDSFVDRIFTPAERAYCRSKKNAAQHFSGRWAAKEAAMKALGTGFVPGIRWHDFEILPESSGAPKLVLSGGAAERAASTGMTRWHVTMSHGKAYATATVIGEGLRERRESGRDGRAGETGDRRRGGAIMARQKDRLPSLPIPRPQVTPCPSAAVD